MSELREGGTKGRVNHDDSAPKPGPPAPKQIAVGSARSWLNRQRWWARYAPAGDGTCLQCKRCVSHHESLLPDDPGRILVCPGQGVL